MKGKYTKEFIREKISTNNVWLEKGIVAIYNKQTEDEMISKDTHHKNSWGFNVADAKYLSYMATSILSGYRLSGGHLTESRRKMLKYSGQLAKIANEN